jgi:hypothetical protein
VTRNDWIRIVGGTLIGLTGLLLLARLDIPHIEQGGWPAIFAGAELLFAASLLSAGLGLATIREEDDSDPGT